jgi:hypothetical protein
LEGDGKSGHTWNLNPCQRVCFFFGKSLKYRLPALLRSGCASNFAVFVDDWHSWQAIHSSYKSGENAISGKFEILETVLRQVSMLFKIEAVGPGDSPRWHSHHLLFTACFVKIFCPIKQARCKAYTKGEAVNRATPQYRLQG